MKKIISILSILSIIILSTSCGMIKDKTSTEAKADNETDIVEVTVDNTAPIIDFVPEKTTEDGLPEYYLFDDNPEHLNSKFLADGETPSSIAHFEDLTPGVYTVFSYHHRGYSVDMNADLYYDTVFSSNSNGEFEIINLGIDQNWDWNQAWADYTKTTVSMPEFLRTYNCTCGDKCTCATEDGKCIKSDCPAIIKNQSREPKTSEFDNLNTKTTVKNEDPVYMSDLINHISDAGLNHFRYGGWNEPVWMMMKFKVTSGTVTFDTIAYTDKESAKNNFKDLLKAPFDNESQYKGIAQNAPIVKAEFDYTISDDTKPGPMPITVKNARVPGGYTISNGTFATNVNTWREPNPIAAESDLMLLEYKDDTKLNMYGKDVSDKDNIWHFDPFHTKAYGGYDNDWNEKLSSYGVAVGDLFVPNGSILEINHPTGSETSSNDFYKYNACNLGNFGVTDKYKIHLSNTGNTERTFSMTLKSIAGQVYRYKQYNQDGLIIKSDGGSYIMKKFDDDPKEDKSSKSDPKERVTPAEYGDTISFNISPGEKSTIEIEVTTLTGCVAPMHNTFTIK